MVSHTTYCTQYRARNGQQLDRRSGFKFVPGAIDNNHSLSSSIVDVLMCSKLTPLGAHHRILLDSLSEMLCNLWVGK